MAHREAEALQKPDYTFTVSARGKLPQVPVWRFLRRQFGQLPLWQIESLFGFVEPTTLYGGRIYQQRELSDRDVVQLNNAEIGLRLPLSNHYVTRDEYRQSLTLLERYHRRPNSVIVTNDELAGWIRRDFPDYRIDASVIKNINSLRKLDEAMQIYDEAVLPMAANEDFEFLEAIPDKHRVTLFANAGCAFTCPSKTCYVSISRRNKNDPDEPFNCSQKFKEREQLGMIEFDLEHLVSMGFKSFKLLRVAPGNMTGY